MRGMENFVLAPETGEEKRKADKRQQADGISDKRERHEFAEAAHPADVLLVMAAVDDRACAHEQQRFEEGMRDEMEHPDRYAAHSQAHHHKPKLGDSGISEDA